MLYADDTNIFVVCESLDKAVESANSILSQINEYIFSNLLHINLDKSCFMYFPPKRRFLKISNTLWESRGTSQTIIFLRKCLIISVTLWSIKRKKLKFKIS